MGKFIDGGVVVLPTLPPRGYNSSEGNSVVVHDKVTINAALASGDILRFGPFPAGVVPTFVTFKHPELDTNATPTLSAKIGFSYEDGTVGDDDYFSVAAAFARDVSAASGTQYVYTVDGMTEIQKSWYLDVTMTANPATGATSGEINAVVDCIAVGAK